MRDRHKVGQGWFTQAGVFAPTFGIIGAVFGLMATMGHLDAPAEVGHGIAWFHGGVRGLQQLQTAREPVGAMDADAFGIQALLFPTSVKST